MSEVQDVTKEEENNPLADLVKSSLDKDYNKANEIFNDVMTVKLTDVLDQAKIKLAGQIYNGDPEDEEIEDDYPRAEEIDDDEYAPDNEGSGDDDASINDEDAADENETDEFDIEETEIEGDDDGAEPDEDEDEIEGVAV